MREARSSAPGLYLHVPFCSRICPYCDFSVMHAASPARARFVARLVTEVSVAAPAWRDPRPFDTVYFGGGTPSQLTAEELTRVLESCRTHLAFETAGPWLFLEANPEDVTPEACAAWRSLGVRTLSLGVQSFSDENLRFLGRRHSAREARAAVDTALAAGFDTVSVDLIFGLRGQTPEDWRLDLATAVAQDPQHLSCYQLTIHPRTRFGVQAKHGQFTELSEDEQAVLFELTHRFLADAGFAAYEVSNFARGPAHQSRHNRKYWDHTPYLGLGPSAHSFAAADASFARRGEAPPRSSPTVRFADASFARRGEAPPRSSPTVRFADASVARRGEAPPRSSPTVRVADASGAARRWWNERGTPRWERRLAGGERPIEAQEILAAKDLAAEALLLGLRTTAGIDLDGLQARYGIDLLAANDALVARLVDEGRIVVGADAEGGRRLVPTLSGLAVADGLAAAFDLALTN